MRKLGAVLAGGLAIAITGCGSARVAPPRLGPCVHALVGTHETCLHTGSACLNANETFYEAVQLACLNARLANLPQPAPGFRARIPSGAPATPLDGRTRRIRLPARRGWSPGITDLTVAPSGVWVSSGAFRVRPADNSTRGPYLAGQENGDSQNIAAGDGGVWVAGYNSGVVRRVDPASGRLVATIRLPAEADPVGIAVSPGAVWVAEHHGGAVARIDPRTNQVVATIVAGNPGSSGPEGITTGLGSVWVGVPNTNSVVRIDEVTNRVVAIIPTPVGTPSPCGGLAAGSNAVWVSSCLDGDTVTRIDPRSDKVASVLSVGRVLQLAATPNMVWLVAGADPQLSHHSPAYLMGLTATDRVVRRIRLDKGFISGGVAIGFGSVWASDFVKPLVIRVPTP